jgi:hypothetical protein
MLRRHAMSQSRTSSAAARSKVTSRMRDRLRPIRPRRGRESGQKHEDTIERAFRGRGRAAHRISRADRRSARRGVPGAHRRARRRGARMGVPPREARARRGARARPHAAQEPPARRALRHQGHHRHREPADRIQLADLPRPPSQGRRILRRAPAPRGVPRPRQDGHHRVRQQPPLADAQSARPQAHAGRLLQRLRGRGGRPHGAARARHPDRRLGHPPRRLLRRVRREAQLRQHQPPRHEVRRRIARYDRHLLEDAGRPGARARGPVRPPRPGLRRLHRQAAHRPLPHAALAGRRRVDAGEPRAGRQAPGEGGRHGERLRAACGERGALRPPPRDHGLRERARQFNRASTRAGR